MVYCSHCGNELTASIDWIHLGKDTEDYICRKCGKMTAINTPTIKEKSGIYLLFRRIKIERKRRKIENEIKRYKKKMKFVEIPEEYRKQLSEGMANV